MADITVTAANVAAASDAVVISETAGAAVTIGQVVYKDTDDTWKLAITTSTTTAGANGIGIALTQSAADGQPIQVQIGGSINPGGTLTVGEIYVVSTNAAGGIAPEGDNGSTDYVTVLGVASTASNLKLKPIVSGAQVP